MYNTPASLFLWCIEMKEAIESSLKVTTVKGVPRIINSQSMGLKILWLVAVIILITLSLFQAYQLITEYRSYDTVTSLDIDAKSLYYGQKLFNLQVCNLNILAFRENIGDKIQHEYLETYRNHVEEMSECNNCTEEEKILVAGWKSESSSPHMLFQYMGSNTALENLKHVDNFLVECFLMRFSAMGHSSVPCKNAAVIKVVPNKEFLSCLNIELPENNETHYYSGGLFTFYLDTWPLEFPTPYYGNTFYSGTQQGLSYQLYEPGTAPTDGMNYRELAPGLVSNAMIEHNWIHRLSKPHGQCVHDDIKYTVYGDQEVKHTVTSCYFLCLTDTVQRYCNCTTLNDLIRENATFPFCNSPRNSARERLAFMKCESEVMQRSWRICYKCAIACKEMSIKSTVSQSKWLMRSQFLSFYDQLLKDKPYSYKFQRYIDLLNATYIQTNSSKNYRNKEMENDIASEERVIFNNFAKIKVTLGSSMQLHYREIPKMSMTGLMGQLGGVLNLWSGISVVLVIEIIDLTVRIFHHVRRSPRF